MNWAISREVEKEKLSWMAGVWDGEGCIRAFFGKNRTNFKPCLQLESHVKNTDVLMIKRISEILKDLGIKFSLSISNKHKDQDGVNHKTAIVIKVSGKGNVWKLLTIMFPYLITKKQQASIALELIEYRDSLGYHGIAHEEISNTGRNKGRWSGKLITEDKKIVDLVNKLRDAKDNLIDPSETKRVANKPMEIPVKSLEAYLMI
jgi:hypothetical protein